MDPVPALERAARVAMATKERLVADEGVGADLAPAVFVRTDDGVTVAYLDTGGGVPLTDGLRQVAGTFDADHVTLIHEAYAVSDPDGVRAPAPGELARRFANGDRTVVEAVNLLGVTRDGRIAIATLPYRYAGRRVIWDEPLYRDHPAMTIGGVLPEALEAGFADRGRPDWWTAALRLAAGGILIQGPHGEVVSPEALPGPDDACPCGSGESYATCHGAG